VTIPEPSWVELEFSRVVSDSRHVEPGSLFVAIRGSRYDGHCFIPDACSRGAVAVLGERPAAEVAGAAGGVPYIQVKEVRRLLGELSQRLAGRPAGRLKVVGITGTNGKTSTLFMLRSILEAGGHSCALVGTISYEIGGSREESIQTTPAPEALAAQMAEALSSGSEYFLMEVSSHALDQERVAGVEFDVAIFTNLSRDHLDYHRDMAEYRQAKLKLFTSLGVEPYNTKQPKFIVTNADDPVSEAICAVAKVPVYSYGVACEGAAFRASDIELGLGRTRFCLTTPDGTVPFDIALSGIHNVYNALGAIAAASLLGVGIDAVRDGLGRVKGVPGRFELVSDEPGFAVIVDYAHTEDGLRNLLQAARSVSRGRLIVVFGCGGDRDRGKRPVMGEVAARLADFVVLTSDNPRSEDPVRIILDIEVGMQRAGKAKGEHYRVIVDRAEAIRFALTVARPNDMVIIAGKGHERYQLVGDRRIPFDDREVALRLIRELAAGR